MRKILFIRYLVTGVVAYVVEMATLFGLHHGIGWSAVASVSMSFWVGLSVAFLLQKLVTFQNYHRNAKALFRQLVGYGILVAWNYGFTVAAVAVLQHVMPVYAIRTICILIIVSWNFIIYKKLFTIQKPKTEKEAADGSSR